MSRLCVACGATLANGGASWRCAACGFEPDERDGIPLLAPELADGGAGYEASDFALSASLEAGHFWHRARRRLIAWAFREHFPDAKSFFEVGCGTGFVLTGMREAFPAVEVSGSEVFAEGLRHASERLPGVALFQMDARRIPFRDALDVIGAFDVLEHIEEDEAVLAEMRRAVRPGGGLILTVPQHPFLWSPHDEAAHHVRRYTAKGLASKVRRAGFQVARTTSFVTTLLPPMVLSRLLQRARRRARARDNADEVPEELAVTPLVNRVFERALDAERALIERGVSLPAGGSLLLVARA